jgi:hypothetical protein
MFCLNKWILPIPAISVLLIVLLSHSIAHAEIFYESGAIHDFLGGNCPNCQYDNWISHISEGIASPGYNNYGPVELDPQTNGFGRYQLIESTPAGDSLIAAWYSIFTSFLVGDTSAVESQLISTELDSIYQLVVLTGGEHTFYILREVLNPDYYDVQLTPDDSTDDVQGSFDFGWGVYVYSPFAGRPHIIVEMPHPNDDYITPFFGTDVFMSYSAGFLMVAGAGREVLWTQQGEYNNSKSLSDPSRNYNTVFNTAHRAFIDLHPDNFSLQIHSYDSEPHAGMRSLVVSAGSDDQFPNEPVMDRCVYDDMISYTPYVAVPANTAGNHPDVTIESYYHVYYEGGYSYQGQSPVIPVANDLYGYSQNQQILYSHQNHHRLHDPENFVHIEMDEMPDPIQDTITVYYRTELPGGVTFDNFTNAIQYFRPAYQALLLAMAETPMSELMTGSPSPLAFPDRLVYDTDTLSAFFQNISTSQALLIQGAYADNQIFSVISAPIGTTLYPGQQCSVKVAFHPLNAQYYQRILTLSTDIGCSHLELRGTGLGGVAEMVPPAFDFGRVDISSVGYATVYLRNAGNYPMRMLTLIQDPPHFYFLNFPDSTIQPGGQVPLEILFLPIEIGSYVGNLFVVTDTYSNDTLSYIVRGEGAILTELFVDDFSQDLGWTGYGGPGEWNRGIPMGGLGDDEHGGPDPVGDHSQTPDNLSVGNDLTAFDGDYEPSLGEIHWLTSPIINCAGVENIEVKFWRWLGVERNQYDHAYIQAFDGSAWVTKWQNPDQTVDENVWSLQVIDVSEEADGNPRFRFRFGIGTTDGSWQYCGWNIDDLSIIGTESALGDITPLTVSTCGESSICLTWSTVSGATLYRIYRGDTPAFEVGPETLIDEVASPDTTYQDSGILNLESNAFYCITASND